MEDSSKWSNLEYTARRGDARVAVAEKWANRRKQQEELRQSSQGEQNGTKGIGKKPVPPTPMPPLCVVLRRSWNDTLKAFQNQKRIKPPMYQKPQAQSLQVKRTTFPSVMSILQANAISRQVESFENDGGALRLFPADYDFATAVNHMSESRSRAFLLLDFSAIVQTHTFWRKRLPKKGVQMVYSTRHNAGVELMRLFERLGVGLRVATKYDLDRLRENFADAILWDDCTRLSKPNSFYRRLVLDRTESSADAAIPLTVDGTEEIERIHRQLYSICKRRNRDMPKLCFTLRLDNIETNKWNSRVSELSQKARELKHDVVGVALDLGESCPNENPESADGRTNLLLVSLSALLRYAKETAILSAPQVHLTNPLDSSTIDDHVKRWIEDHAAQCSDITIDVSRLLVANAASLCARIIGVKQNDASRIHYYIDDGCYGSLSNYSKDGIPLPLKSMRNEPSTTGETQHGFLATVWGPTCDGLDKVCSDIILPKLSRDDWLVFVDLGFCNVGTCFNGFAPPDTACCALGGTRSQ